MRRSAASLRLVTLESAAVHGRRCGQPATAAPSSSGSGGSSLLASLRSAAFSAGLTSTEPGVKVAQRAASSVAACCSAATPATGAAAVLLAASRRGVHAAASRSHLPAGLPPHAAVPQCARLTTRAGLAAEVAEAAAAAVPASWAARGGRMRSRVAAARRQLACRMEWALGRGYHAREAFFNAIYMQARGWGTRCERAEMRQEGWVGAAGCQWRWCAPPARLVPLAPRCGLQPWQAPTASPSPVPAPQPNWSKSLLLLLAERLTRGDPRFAWCYSTPVAEVSAAWRPGRQAWI